MPISRRQLVGTETLAVLSAGCPLKAAAKALSRPGLSSETVSPTPDSARARSLLSQEAFSSCVGSEFRIAGQDGGRIRAKLIEVHDWRPHLTIQSKGLGSKAKVPKECFSVVFLAPPRTQLTQNTYKVDHSKLGKFSLFLVPAGRSGQGTYYEAVFKH